MFDFIGSILDYGLGLIASGGYWGVFWITLLENIIPPIPSEVILPFTGYLVFRGEIGFIGVVLAATLANVLGALFFYIIGRYGGRYFIIKYGRYLGFKERDLDSGDAWFDKHGKSVVLFGRMVPIVRSVVSIPAGMAKMSLAQFVIFTSIGSLLWNLMLVAFGYFAGEHWQRVSTYLKEYELLVEVVIAILVVWYIFKRVKHKMQNG